jgi:hypothetical protein
VSVLIRNFLHVHFLLFISLPSHTPEDILIETRYLNQVWNTVEVMVMWNRKRKVSHGTHVVLNKMQDLAGFQENSCFISKVLHTVYFLFKNEFILQNTSTGLQYNLHCALSQRSNVWESLVFLSERLRCWCVWLLRSSH